MADQDRADAESARDQTPDPLPVHPSDNAERHEGLAFDVEPGTELPGVPTGDQMPGHPGAARTQETVRESGDGVGLAVPGDQGTSDAN